MLASPGAENGARQEKGRWLQLAPLHFNQKGCQSGPKMGAKMEPKSCKVSEEIWMNFGTCLDAVFGGVSAVLATRIEPRGGQKRRQKRRGMNKYDLHNKLQKPI